ncbi:MAG: hypothetical protein FWG51_01010 [Firmicutes bacterium]|nr:hypothetical protein [Bacillota bacterium]
MENTSQKLIDFREQNNLTQEGLANLLGVKLNDIICWEKELSLPNTNIIGKLFIKRQESYDLGYYLGGEKKDLINTITYGEALSKKRKEIGMSKKNFAELLNISVYKLSKWEEDIEIPQEEEKKSINLILNADVDGIKKLERESKRTALNNQKLKSITSTITCENGFWYERSNNLELDFTNGFDEKIKEKSRISGVAKFILSVIFFLAVVGNCIFTIFALNAPPATFGLSLFFVLSAIIAFNFTEFPFLAKDSNLDEFASTDVYYILLNIAFGIFLGLAIVFPYFFVLGQI